MRLNKALGSLFLLASLVFVPSVFAGGGPVEFSVEPNSSLNPGEQYIVHARVYANGPWPTYCKGCYIKLAFQNPQAGDYIAQDSETTNDEGRIYAKVQSKVSGERIIIVDQLRDSSGTKINAGSSVALKYTGESIFIKTPTNLRISQIETTGDPNVRNVHIFWDPVPGATSYTVYKPMGGINFYHTTVDTNLYEMKVNIKSGVFYVAVDARKDGMSSALSSVLTIDLSNEHPNVTTNPTPPPANITARIANQQFVEQYSRQVTVKWGAFDGYPGTFTIYVKATTNKNDWEQKFDGSKGPSATFNLKADQDYHIKVHGCMDKFGTCVDSNILLLPKLQKQENPNPTISPAPSGDNKNVEELNKKGKRRFIKLTKS